jgi:hypothetical protein
MTWRQQWCAYDREDAIMKHHAPQYFPVVDFILYFCWGAETKPKPILMNSDVWGLGAKNWQMLLATDAPYIKHCWNSTECFAKTSDFYFQTKSYGKLFVCLFVFVVFVCWFCLIKYVLNWIGCSTNWGWWLMTFRWDGKPKSTNQCSTTLRTYAR